jgi:hypothetical protein
VAEDPPQHRVHHLERVLRLVIAPPSLAKQTRRLQSFNPRRIDPVRKKKKAKLSAGGGSKTLSSGF